MCVLTDERSCSVICKRYSTVAVLMSRGKSYLFKTHLFHVIIFLFSSSPKEVTIKLKNRTPGAGERMGTDRRSMEHIIESTV